MQCRPERQRTQVVGLVCIHDPRSLRDVRGLCKWHWNVVLAADRPWYLLLLLLLLRSLLLLMILLLLLNRMTDHG